METSFHTRGFRRRHRERSRTRGKTRNRRLDEETRSRRRRRGSRTPCLRTQRIMISPRCESRRKRRKSRVIVGCRRRRTRIRGSSPSPRQARRHVRRRERETSKQNETKRRGNDHNHGNTHRHTQTHRRRGCSLLKLVFLFIFCEIFVYYFANFFFLSESNCCSVL